MTWSEDRLRPGERIDELQRKGLRIIQDPKRFCFGTDAVLLAWYASRLPESRTRAVDLCTGGGAVPLLLWGRVGTEQITGIELSPEEADRARRSVALNGLLDRIEIRQGDVRELIGVPRGPSARVGLVTCNPPYFPAGTLTAQAAQRGETDADAAARNLARFETHLTLPELCGAAASLLTEGGHFVLVHRPARLAELMHALVEAGFAPRRLRMVMPQAESSPSLILMDAVYRGGQDLTVEPPLILRDPEGQPTREMEEIYRE